MSIPIAVVLSVCFAMTAVGAETKSAKIRGWLSDERCARGRANGGVYTGTNSDCAKQCVAGGAKIVLVVPDQERVLNMQNQPAAKSHIGDYVEVTGDIDQETNSLHIGSLKMLAEGRAKCDLPKHSSK